MHPKKVISKKPESFRDLSFCGRKIPSLWNNFFSCTFDQDMLTFFKSTKTYKFFSTNHDLCLGRNYNLFQRLFYFFGSKNASALGITHNIKIAFSKYRVCLGNTLSKSGWTNFFVINSLQMHVVSKLLVCLVFRNSMKLRIFCTLKDLFWATEIF